MVSDEIKKVADIDTDDRQDIEDFLLKGGKPLAIHGLMPHIPTKLIRSISAGMKMRGELGADEEEQTQPVRFAPAPKIQTNSSDMLVQVMQMRKDQIAMEMLEEQIVQMREDSAHRRKTRELELRIKELDIREREMDLEADEEQETPQVAQPMQQAEAAIFPNMARNSEWGWILDIIQFANTVKNQPPRTATPPPQQTLMPTEPDFSKPLNIEQIRAEIAKFPKEQVIAAAKMPKLVESELKKRYPNIIPENINSIISELKAYGTNAQ